MASKDTELAVTFHGTKQGEIDFCAPEGFLVSAFEEKLVKLYGGDVKVVLTEKCISIVYNGESDGAFGFGRSRVEGSVKVIMEEEKVVEEVVEEEPPTNSDEQCVKTKVKTMSVPFKLVLRLFRFVLVLYMGWFVSSFQFGVIHSETIPIEFVGKQKRVIKYKAHPMYNVTIGTKDVVQKNGGDVSIELCEDKFSSGIMIEYTGKMNGMFKKSRASGTVEMTMEPKPLIQFMKGKMFMFVRNAV